MTQPTTVAWTGVTDKGRVRTNNEDSFLALTFDGDGLRFLGSTGEGSIDTGDFIFAVSDGMGGEKSGEFASRTAVDRITRMLPATWHSRARGMTAGYMEILTELFQSIHQSMENMGRYYPECQGMGATLTLVWLTPEGLHYAHTGDSRLYHLPRNGALRQVSEDDTHTGWLRRQGKINEREARSHPRKHLLSRALGAGHQYVTPQCGTVICESGDRLLLCSDGIIDGMWDRALGDLLARPEAQARDFFKEAMEGGSRDNATAIVLGLA